MAGDESSVDYSWRNIAGTEWLAGRLRCIDIHLQSLKYDDLDNLCLSVSLSVSPLSLSLSVCVCVCVIIILTVGTFEACGLYLCLELYKLY